MSTVVGDLSLSLRENQLGSLLFDVQSDENFRFKVFEDSLKGLIDGRQQLFYQSKKLSYSFFLEMGKQELIEVIITQLIRESECFMDHLTRP